MKILSQNPTGSGDVALWRNLLPVCLVVFVEFMAMGLPLPVLAYHVSDTLSFGAFAVGLVIGSQSLATLLTRHAAGTRSDQNGPRNATRLGLVFSVGAGVVYALSLAIPERTLSIAILLAGRVLLGVGESLVVTGALSWGVALMGRERSGIVMSWVGVAMYGAIAAGAPLGLMLYQVSGFSGISLAVSLVPVLGLMALPWIRNVDPVGGTRLPFHRVIRMIGLPGTGLALGALGFGALAGFSSLLFRSRDWSHATLVMTAFGSAYVLARLFLGGLPDRFGGARVAMISVALSAVGQFGIWAADSSVIALVFSAVTGLGFALVFPSFGVEAIRNVPPQNRGSALGAFSACFDLSMGLGIPLLGFIVSKSGTEYAFAAGGIAALLGALVAGKLVFFNRRSVP